MKHVTRNPLLHWLCPLLCLTACELNDLPVNNPKNPDSSTRYLLKKISVTNGLQTVIKYNSAGKPVERIVYKGADTVQDKTITQFEYDDSSRLVTITVRDSSGTYGFMTDSLEVLYDAQNRIRALANNHPAGIGTSFCKYTYVGDTVKIYYMDILSPEGGDTDVENDIDLIYDPQGNLSKMIRVWGHPSNPERLTDTVTYHEYDNKPNVYAATNLGSFPATLVGAGNLGLHTPEEVRIPVPLPKNNPVKYTMASSITLQPTEVLYRYMYNDRGLVKTEDGTYLRGGSSYTAVRSYEYGK